jgi:subtilisin family serine protease
MAGSTRLDEYLYVPGELVVHDDDSEGASGVLAPWGYRASARRAGDHLVFTSAEPDAVDVPEVLDRLSREGGRVPRIGPHYGFGTCQRVPRSADHARVTTEELPALEGDPGEVVVGVVDTGVVLDDGGNPHPWLRSRLVGPDDDDREDHLTPKRNGLLPTAAGHGTFVSGVVLREAPAATIRMIAALEEGFANEAAVAEAIERLGGDDVKLINLSFCGDTAHGGKAAPEMLAAAINGLPDDVVVVAAAGNFGDDRPVWPAAMDRVIAVGAVDDEPRENLHRAPFSGYGPWVDVYAPGAFVLGPHVRHEESAHSGTCDLHFCWHGGRVRDPQHYGGWARWSGSSFAVATVTGRIARMAGEQGIPASVAPSGSSTARSASPSASRPSAAT